MHSYFVKVQQKSALPGWSAIRRPGASAAVRLSVVLLRGPSFSQQPCPATEVVGMAVPVCSARHPGRLPVRPLLRDPKRTKLPEGQPRSWRTRSPKAWSRLPGMTIDLPPTIATVDASYLGATAVSDQEKW